MRSSSLLVTDKAAISIIKDDKRQKPPRLQRVLAMEANHNLFRFWGYRKMSLILTYLHRVHYLLIIIEVAWMNHGKTSFYYWSERQSRILVIVIGHDWESRYRKLDLISFCLQQPIPFYLIETKFWFNSLPYPTVNPLGHWSIVHIWVVLTSPNFSPA